MHGTPSSLTLPSFRRLALALALAGLCSFVLPAAGRAAVMTIGSPLSVAATLDTTNNLAYRGTDTQVPPTAEFPNGVVHTAHVGADTAIWNTAPAAVTAPTSGQALKVRLEGCAEGAPGGPAPLRQIHFQDLSPISGGGAKVNLTSEPYEIPECGVGGASGSTVSTYEPVNLCMSPGDFIAFNDEGGYVNGVYRAGVSYLVMGSVPGSSLNSFIGANRTNNGSVLSASDVSAVEGFASSPGQELMLQVVFGTTVNAKPACGGTSGLPPAETPLSIGSQTDGINHQRIVKVAVYCRLSDGCRGTAALAYAGKAVGQSAFVVGDRETGHVPIRVTPKLLALIRKHGGVRVTLSVAAAGLTFSKVIEIKLF
jgi:hypothetical protein